MLRRAGGCRVTARTGKLGVALEAFGEAACCCGALPCGSQRAPTLAPQRPETGRSIHSSIDDVGSGARREISHGRGAEQ